MKHKDAMLNTSQNHINSGNQVYIKLTSDNF